jgi:hypothetical protein
MFNLKTEEQNAKDTVNGLNLERENIRKYEKRINNMKTQIVDNNVLKIDKPNVWDFVKTIHAKNKKMRRK